MTQPQFTRAGTHWLVGDGYIWDNLPASYRPASGRPLECSATLAVYNPQAEAVQVTARFYHVDRAPTTIDFAVPPRGLHTMELATLPEVPHNQSFWITVEADRPVYAQACHADFTYWDQTPDALISVAPYPGPLTDETQWVFPDCYQGGPKSWYERETLTLLNPNQAPVKARIRYLLRAREAGAEEEIEIPGERVAALEIWERSPRLLGSRNGPPIRVQHDYAVRIDATGPVIPQTSRRARWTGRPSVVGARSTMGVPLREPQFQRWYYPGGYIADRGILPRAANCDVTWNLLFIHNLSETAATRATVAFHGPDGVVSQSDPITVPPLKSDLEWLHLAPWLGRNTQVGRPFAMTVESQGAVVPEVTCAEFEMWSQVCPGAMSAVNFYPGPLQDETTWWLGIAPAGGADEEPVEWQQSYHLFNPGDSPVTVTITLLGLGGDVSERTLEVNLGPGHVQRLEAAEFGELPRSAPFAVVARGDGPFCAQTFVRTLTRGLPAVRAMYSHVGTPMPLT
jgi:hypothetical protein